MVIIMLIFFSIIKCLSVCLFSCYSETAKEKERKSWNLVTTNVHHHLNFVWFFFINFKIMEKKFQSWKFLTLKFFFNTQQMLCAAIYRQVGHYLFHFFFEIEKIFFENILVLFTIWICNVNEVKKNEIFHHHFLFHCG